MPAASVASQIRAIWAGPAAASSADRSNARLHRGHYRAQMIRIEPWLHADVLPPSQADLNRTAGRHEQRFRRPQNLNFQELPRRGLTPALPPGVRLRNPEATLLAERGRRLATAALHRLCLERDCSSNA